jgi:hypothetical protein
MLRASSLFYATSIALIIAILTSSFILFSYFNRLQFDQSLMLDRVVRNASSGIQLLLSDQETPRTGEKEEKDLYGSSMDSVSLERRAWGAYELLISTAHWKHLKHQKMALSGYAPLKENRTSLYLADNDRPLALCGNTVLKGTCYIPKAGVKRAYIEGQSFSGMKLIQGEVKESKRELPPLNKELIQELSKRFAYQPGRTDSLVFAEQFEKTDSIVNTFDRPTVFVYSKGAISLAGKKIHGNVVIISEIAIRADENTDLQQAMLFAPYIQLGSSFRGSMQLFASDSIVMKKKARLLFPSIIGLFRQEDSPPNMFVRLEEDAEMAGAIIAYQENADFTKHVKVSMDRHSIVKGMVYSSSLADIKGTIEGTLICDKTILVTPSAVYENHLLNAVIDVTRLSPYYVASGLVTHSTIRNVVQWVY